MRYLVGQLAIQPYFVTRWKFWGGGAVWESQLPKGLGRLCPIVHEMGRISQSIEPQLHTLRLWEGGRCPMRNRPLQSRRQAVGWTYAECPTPGLAVGHTGGISAKWQSFGHDKCVKGRLHSMWQFAMLTPYLHSSTQRPLKTGYYHMQHFNRFRRRAPGQYEGNRLVRRQNAVVWSLLIGIVWGTLSSAPSVYASSSVEPGTVTATADSGETVSQTLRPPVRERSTPLVTPAIDVELTIGPGSLPSTTRARGNYVEVLTSEPARGIPYAPASSSPSRGRFIPRERR